MSDPESDSPDSGPVPGTPTPAAGGASQLSIDQLSQAFAQLMGEQQEDASATGRVAALEDANRGEAAKTEASAATGSTATVSDEDEGEIEGRVTPESIIEAMLFVGHPENRPLTSRTIASFLRGVSPQEVDTMIQDLNRLYLEQKAPYEIVERDGGYHMGLREEFHRLRDVFLGRVREARLNQAAIDLLAIVAYQQPVTQDRIDALRGQPSSGTLAQLVRRQLLQVEYTREKPRKKVYRTTDRFLDLMGIQSLDDLPSHEDF